jgi:hypothetical protein
MLVFSAGQLFSHYTNEVMLRGLKNRKYCGFMKHHAGVFNRPAFLTITPMN